MAGQFLSVEPLLGPLPELNLQGIDGVIVGGESGPGARPMEAAWVRAVLTNAVPRPACALLLEAVGRREQEEVRPAAGWSGLRRVSRTRANRGGRLNEGKFGCLALTASSTRAGPTGSVRTCSQVCNLADTRANASPKRKQGITRVTFHAGSGSAWVSGPVDWSPTNRHRSLRRPDPARTEPEPRSHSIADRPAARESGRMSRHNDRSWQTPPTLRCRVEPASVDSRRVLDQRIRPVCGRCRHAHPPTSARRESPFRRPAHSGKSRSGSRWAPAAERHPGLPVQCAAGPR